MVIILRIKFLYLLSVKEKVFGIIDCCWKSEVRQILGILSEILIITWKVYTKDKKNWVYFIIDKRKQDQCTFILFIRYKYHHLTGHWVLISFEPLNSVLDIKECYVIKHDYFFGIHTSTYHHRVLYLSTCLLVYIYSIIISQYIQQYQEQY